MEQTPAPHVTSMFVWNVALFAFDPILTVIMTNFTLFELYTYMKMFLYINTHPKNTHLIIFTLQSDDIFLIYSISKKKTASSIIHSVIIIHGYLNYI